MSFEVELARWSFGWLPSEELPDVAAKALLEGMECPSLIELVAADKAPDPTLHGLFERVLRDLGRIRPTRPAAGTILVRDYARQIVDGSLPAIEGARLIARISLECQELQDELAIFRGRVSEYDGLSDYPAFQKGILELIISAAKRLAQA